MIVENIYVAILIASLATYFIRSSGVFLSKKIELGSKSFKLISYISIGVIVAIITRIIIFPKGILLDTPSVMRCASVVVLIISYFLFRKNVVFSTIMASLFFFFCLKIFN